MGHSFFTPIPGRRWKSESENSEDVSVLRLFECRGSSPRLVYVLNYAVFVALVHVAKIMDDP